MSALGKRLTEERKRIGLSQSAFADLLGVSFSSQRRYEDGRSSPDTVYLDSLGRHGVDVQYVMTGRVRQTAKGYSFETLAEFGLAVAKRCQISPDELQALANAVSDASNGVEEPEAIEQRVDSYETAFFVHTSAFLEKRLQSIFAMEAPAIDPSLLAEILEAIDLVSSTTGASLPLGKKAQVVTMLYRAFKASGKVDPTIIEEAVRLALG